MSLINITNLTFAYSNSYDTVFENTSFQIDTAWKLGLTGRNGRGKTTFLQLLLGKHEYSGSITAGVDFAYFPYAVPDPGAFTVDVLGCISPDSVEWELLRELSLLDVPEDALHRPYNTLSPGEQTKVLLAVLFCRENSFLLIDEPTNHLDREARELVSHYLRSKSGFILVSHDRAFLDGCIDHILAINKETIEIQRGNFSSWLVNKERQDNFELAQNARLQKDIARLAQAARQSATWSNQVEKTKYDTKISGIKPDKGYLGHKSAKMMKRSMVLHERRQTALDEKSQLLKNLEDAENLKLTQLHYHKNRLVLLDSVSIHYGNKTVCQSVSFSIEPGDRVALWGKNGSGKTSLLNLINDESIAYTGRLQKGSHLKISFVSQDTSFLCGSLSDFAQTHAINESLFKTILRKLDFSRLQFDKDMQDFSEGQKKKALIARSLCQEAHLLIWDEPLNYIDIISRMQIEDLLMAYRPTILFVEHDRVFCDAVATKKVLLS